MKNTEMLLPFELVKENKEEVIPRIGEGCVELEKILNCFINLNIPTIAFCAGHKIGDYPYITVNYDKYTRRKVNAFLNALKDIKGVQIMFSSACFTDNPFNVTVYTKRNNRDRVFSIISTALINNIESEYLADEIEVGLRLAINMDYLGNYSTVTIFSKLFQRKYMVGIRGEEKEINNILDYYKDKRMGTQIGMRYYLYNSNRQLNIISDKLEMLNQIFYHPNGFKIISFSSTIEKVDRINKL